MSPPIYTPDGSEVSEIVLPDGSTASEVIGPDGNVLFGAGGDIPDSGIYLDDVADNKLSGRDSYSETAFDGTEPIQSDFSNPSRPEWSVDSGSPSASNGEIVLPAGDSTDQIISTPLSNDDLRWDFEFECQSTPSSGRLGIQFLFESNDDVYQIDIEADGTYRIQAREGGSGGVTVSGSWPVDTQRHTGAVTHDGARTLELYLDGESQGTGTESRSIPNYTNIRIANGGAAGSGGLDAEVRVDNFRVF